MFCSLVRMEHCPADTKDHHLARTHGWRDDSEASKNVRPLPGAAATAGTARSTADRHTPRL